MADFESTPNLPQLVVPLPECGHCGEEVHMDGDSAWCENCRVAWERIYDGDVSEPDTDREATGGSCWIVEDPIGGAAVGMTLVFGPCILPSGHDSDHLAPMRREFPADNEIGRQP